ncbi:MAG: efflux RND transporter periplasmic adaptor subunit [Ardenticatenaceae bacterium]|nr:efflux RND transporter periplasmic adaptor subunit [Anaerolineales bacterium]MCB8937809.1 efflux RND transporter periplasmic adaptor subunit [Ardenticatenaceae bacterium]MCB8974378.1 efflux RND transporter periplasmic adaptor subunit [Ardenticatenaceae bacterium]
MRHGPPVFVRVIIVIAVVAAGAYWFFFVRDVGANGRITASGTIETTEIKISPEMGGRVLDVLVDVGDTVGAGQPLVQFDTALLAGQLAQAQAGLGAAQASYDLVQAGASAEQIAAGETAVARAQASLNALQEQLDILAEDQDDLQADIDDLTDQIEELTATVTEAQTLRQTQPSADLLTTIAQAQGELAGLNGQLAMSQQLQSSLAAQEKLLETQQDVAEAGVDAAQAQLDQLLAGARPEQVAAAAAQVQAAEAAVSLIELQISRLTLTAPAAGVVLERTVEPGEMRLPGGTLLTLGELAELTITVFVPEDLYGQIGLGETAVLTVDSFPNEQFTATVVHVADHAEFTPRNVQTAEGRASTVFAIELAVQDGLEKLRPGMPADVDFGPT